MEEEEALAKGEAKMFNEMLQRGQRPKKIKTTLVILDAMIP